MKLEETILGKPKRHVPYDPQAEIVPPKFLRKVVGLPAITVWRLRRAGMFPEPLRLSVGRIGWRRRDLEVWLAERQTTR